MIKEKVLYIIQYNYFATEDGDYYKLYQNDNDLSEYNGAILQGTKIFVEGNEADRYRLIPSDFRNPTASFIGYISKDSKKTSYFKMGVEFGLTNRQVLRDSTNLLNVIKPKKEWRIYARLQNEDF